MEMATTTTTLMLIQQPWVLSLMRGWVPFFSSAAALELRLGNTSYQTSVTLPLDGLKRILIVQLDICCVFY